MANKHELIRCQACGHYFSPISVRKCTHPMVVAKFSESDTADICYYHCKKCMHADKSALTSAVGCNYGK